MWAAQPAPPKKKAEVPKRGGSRHSARVRDRQTMLATVAVLDEAVANSADPTVTHNAGIIHMFGDDADEFLTEVHGNNLGKASKSLYQAVMKGALPKPVATSEGTVTATKKKAADTTWFRVVEGGELVEHKNPRSTKDIMHAPDSTEWLIEESNAIHHSILAFPGNEVVAVDDILEMGDTVTIIGLKNPSIAFLNGLEATITHVPNTPSEDRYDVKVIR